MRFWNCPIAPQTAAAAAAAAASQRHFSLLSHLDLGVDEQRRWPPPLDLLSGHRFRRFQSPAFSREAP